MKPSNAGSDYALGSTHAEHERLVRQAGRLASLTERLFRQAGIGRGQRVLDVGSGVGDVAMLAARLVGPSGKVVGIERDIRSITRARARVAEAGLQNVTFTQCDANQITNDEAFDAAVGRLILMFLPEPVSVLRSVSQLVRPGGIVAFQEPSWAPGLALAAHLPLWCAAVSVSLEALQRSGADTEMGLALYRIFQEAGLPAPTMSLELPIGTDRDFIRWIYDVLCSLRPQIKQFNISLEKLGDFEDLPQRLESEVEGSRRFVSWMGMVGAWCHKSEL